MEKPLMCSPELLATSLAGKVALVTGGNSGVGLVTAEQLARQGAEVVIACRRVAEGERAAADIRSRVPGTKLEVRELDLASLASVRAFAARFLREHSALHLLINNAGVMKTPRAKTKDGFELQLGTNHLGHFLLTELLRDLLVQSAPARIVILSSAYHDRAMGRDGVIDFDDLHFERRAYDGWRAYAQSKLANLLHAQELARQLEGTGVVAVSVHPGWVRTNLMRHSMPGWMQFVARPLLRRFGLMEPWEGAQTSLYAALSPDVAAHPGAYFSQTGLYRDKSKECGGWPLESPNPVAHDATVARRLFSVSQTLVGLQPLARAAAV